MAKFAYNNDKNTSTGHTCFEVNCGYHSCVPFKEDTDSCFPSKSADKLLTELQELITICWQNLYHAQKLQKQAQNKGVKLRSYTPNDKIWLNDKYIKTKQNQQLEAKFFGPFQVLCFVSKQSYKRKLPKRWKIHDVFHISLLELGTTRKGRVDKKVTELEFEAGNRKKYKLDAIRDRTVYANEIKSHLPGLYYLVA